MNFFSVIFESFFDQKLNQIFDQLFNQLFTCGEAMQVYKSSFSFFFSNPQFSWKMTIYYLFIGFTRGTQVTDVNFEKDHIIPVYRLHQGCWGFGYSDSGILDPV